MSYNAQQNVGQITKNIIDEEAKDEYGNCLVCQRSGLAVLPLRWTLTAAPFEGEERDPNKNNLVDAKFDKPPKGADYPTKLCKAIKNAGYRYRVLRKGYLYVYLVPDQGEDISVECYEVTEQGHFRKRRRASDMPDGEVKPLPEDCVVNGHDVAASFIYLDDQTMKEAWFAFTGDPWPLSVINRYKDLFKSDIQRFRERFQGINAKTLESLSIVSTFTGYISSVTRYKPVLGDLNNDFLANQVLEYKKYLEVGMIFSRYGFSSLYRRLYPLQQAVLNYLAANKNNKALENGIPVIKLKDTIGDALEANHLRYALATEKNFWQNEEMRQYQFLTSKEISKYQDVMIEVKAQKERKDAQRSAEIARARGYVMRVKSLEEYRAQERNKLATEEEIQRETDKRVNAYEDYLCQSYSEQAAEDLNSSRYKDELPAMAASAARNERSHIETEVRLKRARETLYYDAAQKKQFDDAYVQWSNRFTEVIRSMTVTYDKLLKRLQDKEQELHLYYDYAQDNKENADDRRSATCFVDMVSHVLSGAVHDAPLFDTNNEPKNATPLTLLELKDQQRTSLKLWQSELLDETKPQWLLWALGFRNEHVIQAWKKAATQLQTSLKNYNNQMSQIITRDTYVNIMKQYALEQDHIRKELQGVIKAQGLGAHYSEDGKIQGLLALLVSGISALQELRSQGWNDEEGLLFDKKLSAQSAQYALLLLVMGGYLNQPMSIYCVEMSEQEVKRIARVFSQERQNSVDRHFSSQEKTSPQTATVPVSESEVSFLSQDTRIADSITKAGTGIDGSKVAFEIVDWGAGKGADYLKNSNRITAEQFNQYVAASVNISHVAAMASFIVATLNCSNAFIAAATSFGQKQEVATLELASAMSATLGGLMGAINSGIKAQMGGATNYGWVMGFSTKNVETFLSKGGAALGAVASAFSAYSALTQRTMALQGGELQIVSSYYAQAAGLYAISTVIGGAAVFLALPVFGWAAFFISVAASYYIKQGQMAQQTPFDRWFYRCCFGRLEDENNKAEMQAYLAQRIALLQQEGEVPPPDEAREEQWHDGFTMAWKIPKYKKAALAYWYALWQGLSPGFKVYVEPQRNRDMHDSKTLTEEERRIVYPQTGWTSNYYTMIELEAKVDGFSKEHSAYSLLVFVTLTKGDSTQVFHYNWKGDQVSNEVSYLQALSTSMPLPSRPLSKVHEHYLKPVACKPDFTVNNNQTARGDGKGNGVKEMYSSKLEADWSNSLWGDITTEMKWGLDLDPSDLYFAEVMIRYWPNAQKDPTQFIEMRQQEALRYKPDTGECYM